MCDVTESALDVHFASQLHVMGEHLTHITSLKDSEICQVWLKIFNNAPRKEKYARNCLLLLMFSQLRERGKFVEPFNRSKNFTRPLDDVLTEYPGPTKVGQWLQEKDAKYMNILGKDAKSAVESEKHVTGRGDKYCFHCDSRSFSKSSPPPPATELSTKQKLMSEINEMHAFVSQSADRWKLGSTTYPQSPLAKPEDQLSSKVHKKESSSSSKVLRQLEHNTLKAIKKIKNWNISNSSINLLSIILQDIVINEPVATCTQFKELDEKLEKAIKRLLEQEGERREINVREFYDKLLKQQRELFTKEKEQFCAQALEYKEHKFISNTNNCIYGEQYRQWFDFDGQHTDADQKLSTTFNIIKNNSSSVNTNSSCGGRYDKTSPTKIPTLKRCPYCSTTHSSSHMV